jgi:hypothetical protein
VDWLTSLPAGPLLAGCLALTVSITFLARVVVRIVVPVDEHANAPQIAAPLMPALGALFGILMALTLANEAGQLRSAQDIVADEAAAASRLAWAATGPGIDTSTIHGAFLDYLEDTRSDEWRGEAAAEGDSNVGADIANLEHAVRAEAGRSEIGSPASTELLASLDATTTLRRHRIAAAEHQIPLLYVVTILVSGVALIVNAGALALRASVRTTSLLLGLAIVVGMSLALLIALSAPWRGPLIVSGQPIDAVIRDLRDGFFS